MGYVNDPDVFMNIAPQEANFVTGTWNHATGGVVDTISVTKAANAETSVVTLPICLPASKKENKGAYIKSIALKYDITVEAMTTVTAAINLVTMGADGAAPTVASIPFTYDAGHDTAGERIDIDEHKMTLTITTPFYLDDAEQLLVQLTFEAGANGLIAWRGGQVNFTYKM